MKVDTKSGTHSLLILTMFVPFTIITSMVSGNERLKYFFIRLVMLETINPHYGGISLNCVCATENWSRSSLGFLCERGFRVFYRCCRHAASVCWRWGGGVLSCHCSTSHCDWNHWWRGSQSRGGNKNKSTICQQKILHYDPHFYHPTPHLNTYPHPPIPRGAIQYSVIPVNPALGQSEL